MPCSEVGNISIRPPAGLINSAACIALEKLCSLGNRGEQLPRLPDSKWNRNGAKEIRFPNSEVLVLPRRFTGTMIRNNFPLCCRHAVRNTGESWQSPERELHR
jgi:hypothetical protein